MAETPASQDVEAPDGLQAQTSLSTSTARNLAHTTKSVPQMQGISSRWLLRILPWVQVSGGTYRVNRRLLCAVADGRVDCEIADGQVQVIPAELTEIPLLREVSDGALLKRLAGRFEQQEVEAGATLAKEGQKADGLVVIAHGRADLLGAAAYEGETSHGTLSDGDYLGEDALVDKNSRWAYTVRAMTPCTLMVLPRRAFKEIADRSPELRAQLEEFVSRPEPPVNRRGEADIGVASGHEGEPTLHGAFVDYDPAPREYSLSVAQTVLRVHTRVADLYNEPMDQVEQQLRLTVEALRERQEHELINNREFGLLHNADFKQRIPTRGGPPTPDDMDELLSMRRKTKFFLAHRRTIAAFARECTRTGISEPGVDFHGHHVFGWRGVPFLPCNKIPVSPSLTSSIIALRTGEEDEGVIGLHQTGIPDEYEPSLSVRFMGIDEKAVISYLVSAYYSVAVLLPSALGVLENVEIGHYGSEDGLRARPATSTAAQA
ncbi:family 2B encapsulin nanocompartment shell protein [Streptomyces aureoverticillatus]|uniref:family 2B encapsulin nanocompartment shell protein n=1 Tax=Streptomyces aureoverticillatus TaxID=66871 RepID=UPI0013DC24F2|nr:family 2B encapsulin nanocompartment shell protein [Streptomyces aureoverticillatus]QIB42002.1 cyclic nucleotide-binding domain-containing protein [Streptomyces aureoverticillatus]